MKKIILSLALMAATASSVNALTLHEAQASNSAIMQTSIEITKRLTCAAVYPEGSAKADRHLDASSKLVDKAEEQGLGDPVMVVTSKLLADKDYMQSLGLSLSLKKCEAIK